MDPRLRALEIVFSRLSFTEAWQLRRVSRGFKEMVERYLCQALGPDGSWFVVFGGGEDHGAGELGEGVIARSGEVQDHGGAQHQHRISKVYMKAMAYDPQSCIFTFQPVDLFNDAPGTNGKFPSQLTTLPVYTLHMDRIFWTCTLERLALAPRSLKGGPRSLRFAASEGKLKPIILESIPLRHMSFHRPLVFGDGEQDDRRISAAGEPIVSKQPKSPNSDFWMAGDGSQWVMKKIVTPDFLLGYATRSETTQALTSNGPATSELSSNVISSDFVFQYENGTDVSVHMLFARGTPSALFEGERVIEEWSPSSPSSSTAKPVCGPDATQDGSWVLELSIAEAQYDDYGLATDAQLTEDVSPLKPIVSNTLRLKYGASEQNLDILVAQTKPVAPPAEVDEDKGETTSFADPAPEPILCSFGLPAQTQTKKKTEEKDETSAPSRVSLPLSLRLVRLDGCGNASAAATCCDHVVLLTEDVTYGIDFSSLHLGFSLKKEDERVHVCLTEATCSSAIQLISSMFIVTPSGTSRRLGIYSRERATHFDEACARLLINARGRERLLWDDSILEWLAKTPGVPGSFEEVTSLLEERIDVTTVDRLKMRRLALDRRVNRLAKELTSVLSLHTDLTMDSETVAKDYWNKKVGDDLRIELKSGDWEPNEVAESIVVAKKREMEAKKKQEAEAAAAAAAAAAAPEPFAFKAPNKPAARNPLKERNTSVPRIVTGVKSPVRKRSRLSIADTENESPVVAGNETAAS